ncbi:Glucosaminyl phosphatidylinositol (GlcN-PI) nositol acylation protein [Vanrija albida]|uniref:GPI-anchored wall transfer protein n=1 Tax=Vanrija albida TaxID=181172 RepID=A0ABR3Q5M4_9TREE
MSSYKEAKEAFVADNPGSSVFHVSAVSAAAFTAYALYAIAARRFRSPAWDWAIMVLPTLLAVTLFADRAFTLNALLAAAAAFLWLGAPAPAPPPKPKGQWLDESDSDEDAEPLSPGPRSPLASGIKLPSQLVAESLAQAREEAAAASPTSLFPPEEPRRRRSPSPTSPIHIDIGSIPPSPQQRSDRPVPKLSVPRPPVAAERTARGDTLLPFLSVYRAHMMLMTVHAILAVDFPVFPRVLGKCENFGTSLMDIGVGSFVFSLGIVSSRTFSPRSGRRRWIPALIGSLRRAAPVLALGFVRLLMVKGSEYPEHLTEYGVHWNFFFTLGLVPALATALLPLRRYLRWTTIGLLLTAVQQLVLSNTGLQAFLLSAARPGLLGENKEGIASMPGYGAIFLLGLSAGDKVLRVSVPPKADDDGAHRLDSRQLAERATKRKTQLAFELVSYATISWAALALSYVLGIKVSRRFANLPYVVWTVAYNTTALALYLAIELWLFPPASPAPPCPPLLDAINRNGLVVFLIANLLTGLINVSMKTMYAGTFTSMTILTAYSAGVSAFAWAIRRHRIKL